MARNQRDGRNNNPEGHNQYSSSWMDSARERPFTAAATAAAAVGAGVFLWSRRNQISEQLGNLSDQIADWTEQMTSGSSNRSFDESGRELEMADTGTTATMSSGNGGRSASNRGKGKTSARGMSPTGGGNASIGAHTGSGAGTTA